MPLTLASAQATQGSGRASPKAGEGRGNSQASGGGGATSYVITADTIAPTVWIASGSVSGAVVTDTVYWCDNNSLVQSSAYVNLNGVGQTFTYATATISGCVKGAKSTVTLTLSPGSNQVNAGITDNAGNAGTATDFHQYYTVTVAAVHPTTTAPLNSTHTDTFTVTNTDARAQQYQLTPDCGSFTSCAGAGTLQLAGGASGRVVVSSKTGAAGTNNVVKLTAVNATATADGASATTSVSVQPISVSILAWRPNVSSLAGVSHPDTFTITNNSQATQVYHFSANCGAFTQCATDMQSWTFAAGAALRVIVTSFTNSSVSSNRVTLTASNTAGEGDTASASATVSLKYTPTVLVWTPTRTSLPNSTAPDTFTVTNTDNVGHTYQVTPDCGSFTPCSIDISTLTLGGGGAVRVIVSTATGGGPATNRVGVRVANTSATMDTASGGMTVTVAEFGLTAAASASNVSVPARGAAQLAFKVRNLASETASFSLAVTCPASALTTCNAPSRLQLAARDSAWVQVGITAGTQAATANVSLTATADGDQTKSASATTAVTVSAPTVLANATPGAWPSAERSACLAIALRPELESQCDAFRITHTLPGVITRNKGRAPTLVYYSDQVYPSPILADITVPASDALPDSIRLEVHNRTSDGVLSTAVQAARNWPWSAGHVTSRVAINGVYWSQPLQRYQVKAYYWYNASPGWVARDSVDGELMTPKRISDLTQGWWIGSIETLYPGQGPTAYRDSVVVWMGGDGSLRKFTSGGRGSAHTVYVAAGQFAGPDTLFRDSTSTGIKWERQAGNGVRVAFDQSGRHTMTINRANDTTRFVWNTARTLQLDTLVVPGGLRYVFRYDANNNISEIGSPSPSGTGEQTTRFTTALVKTSTTYGITQITDPDGKWVSFEWTSWASNRPNIGAMTDRRGIRTAINWEGWGTGLASTVTPNGSQTITHKVRNAFSVALAPVANGGHAVPIDTGVYTSYDGPRTDVGDITKFWINSMSAPVKIVNALGQTTTVRYSDPRFPGLPTEVVTQSNVLSGSWYNLRGLPDSSVTYNPYGDGRNVRTRTIWDAKWDVVVADTGAEGEATSRAVDPISGNVLWAQFGPETTYVHYNALNQVDSTWVHDGGAAAVERFAFDQLGNVSTVIGPVQTPQQHHGVARNAIGWAVADSTVGCPTSSQCSTPVAMVTTTSYDLMGRPSDTKTYQTGGVDSLEVTTVYNANGQPLTVTQTALPARAMTDADTLYRVRVHAFTYDSIGRKLSETDGGMATNSWTYDVAGNVIGGGRELSGLTQSFDALNRVTSITGSNYSATFSYDPVTGGMTSAVNANAQIRRTYYPNGALKTDTALIANVDFTGWDGPYGLSFTYDRSGRRIGLTLPDAYRPNARIGYVYNASTGLLASVTDPNGNVIRYHYDANNRLDTLSWRHDSLTDVRGYDLASRLIARVNGLVSYGITYDGLGRITADEGAYTFDDLGHVATSNRAFSEQFKTDALDNRLSDQGPGVHGSSHNTSYHYSSYGPLAFTRDEYSLTHDTTSYSYSGWGSRTSTDTRKWTTFSRPVIGYDSGYVETIRSDGYGPGELLVGSWKSIDTTYVLSGGGTTTPYQDQESYRYDALRRRVWQRMVRGDQCMTIDPSSGCLSSQTETVWDGSEMILETRNSTSGTTGSQPPGNPYGTVVYVNSTDIDQPLEILKNGDHDVIPIANAQGTVTRGGCPVAACLSTDVFFAAGDAGVYGGPGSMKDSPNFYGSLVNGGRDGSGYLYKRNRYVDAATGTFTQADPIGIAGGLNVYGFGGADPVNYSDPYGLCPDPADDCPKGVFTVLGTVAGAIIGGVGGGGAGLVAALPTGETASVITVPTFSAAGAQTGAAAGAIVGASIDHVLASVNQMNKDIRQGRAPREVKRVDKGKVTGEQDHVHFKDGTALNKDGSWKHGVGEITRAVADWLASWGW